MKAIHNDMNFEDLKSVTVVNKAKIQNESNSQRSLAGTVSTEYCC